VGDGLAARDVIADLTLEAGLFLQAMEGLMQGAACLDVGHHHLAVERGQGNGFESGEAMIGRGKDGQTILEKRPAAQPFGVDVRFRQQRAAEFVFEPLDGAGQVRLRDVAALCGAGEVLGLGEGEEISDLDKVYTGFPSGCGGSIVGRMWRQQKWWLRFRIGVPAAAICRLARAGYRIARTAALRTITIGNLGEG
jgi:hypothetical protein